MSLCYLCKRTRNLDTHPYISWKIRRNPDGSRSSQTAAKWKDKVDQLGDSNEEKAD
jgi:hypothetical protein